MQKHDLSEYHQWPFYCAICDLVVDDPYTHRMETHPHDENEGLAGEWDMRRVELGASHECGRVITEPNGWNLDVSQLTRDESKAARSKHRYYYANVALSHCDRHDHDWSLYNGGPVEQCTDCYAFDLTDYDPANPGPPTVEPDRDSTALTPDEEEASKINKQLSEFTTDASSTTELPNHSQTRKKESLKESHPTNVTLSEFGPNNGEGVSDG
jgi:hypothetical protein